MYSVVTTQQQQRQQQQQKNSNKCSIMTVYKCSLYKYWPMPCSNCRFFFCFSYKIYYIYIFYLWNNKHVQDTNNNFERVTPVCVCVCGVRTHDEHFCCVYIIISRSRDHWWSTSKHIIGWIHWISATVFCFHPHSLASVWSLPVFQYSSCDWT